LNLYVINVVVEGVRIPELRTDRTIMIRLELSHYKILIKQIMPEKKESKSSQGAGSAKAKSSASGSASKSGSTGAKKSSSSKDSKK
jgi:hypothetical protein